MSISAFSRRSSLSVKALRLYDEMGLLRPERVDTSSRYRYYGESQLETARLISLLRKLDVPLAEIALVINQEREGASQALDAWWQGELERMTVRSDLIKYIRGSVLDDAGVHDLWMEGFEVGVREVAAQTYLYRTRHLHGPELPHFIAESTEHLLERAASYGGAIGHISVMFHGQVDLDSDGPVDVCVPVASDSVAAGDDLLRTEFAHLQAFTALRRYQLEFPQILQIYQGLRQWIDVNGYAISGLPREIYVVDYHAVAADETVCEVAYPIQSMKGTTR